MDKATRRKGKKVVRPTAHEVIRVLQRNLRYSLNDYDKTLKRVKKALRHQQPRRKRIENMPLKNANWSHFENLLRVTVANLESHKNLADYLDFTLKVLDKVTETIEQEVFPKLPKTNTASSKLTTPRATLSSLKRRTMRSQRLQAKFFETVGAEAMKRGVYG